MRTIHYDRCAPLVTPFEITNDFGDLVEFDDVAELRTAAADRWTKTLIWDRAGAFVDSGMEVI